MLNDQWNIKSMNTSAQHLFGYFTKEIAGKHFSNLLPKYYRNIFKLKVAELLETSRPGDLEEIREAYLFFKRKCENEKGEKR